MKQRLACLGFYFGTAPFVRLRRKPAAPLAAHHLGQSLALFAVLLCVVLASIALYAIGTALLLNFPELYESYPLDYISAIAQICLFAVWVLAWLLCLVLAGAGSARPVPLLDRIARRGWLISLSAVWTALLVALVLTVAILAFYATSITAEGDRPGQVYMIYDDMGFVPRWVFALGFMRISLAANERWGDESTVVALLSRTALRRAFAEGRLVFVACHGAEGFVYTPRDSNQWLDPSEVRPMEKGADLQEVYLAGCDLGARAKEWETALSPAQVMTFDRLSATAEHVGWLWLTGPERIAALE